MLHVICDLAGGGAERMVLSLAGHARDSRHSVAPVHPTGSLRPAFQDAGVPVIDLDRQRGRPGVRAALRLARIARDYDIVQTHLWAGDTWGRLGAGLARHPAVISTEHNTRPEDAWRQRVSVALHPVSRVVVAVSQAAADVARASGVPADKLRVLHNGVDLSGFQPLPAPQRPVTTVLGLGRLTRQKGFDLLADAVGRVPGLHLELVGEGEEAAALRAAGATLHGWVEDVRPLMSRADIVAIPSRWEGFGLVAVEAMASGLPVVAAAIPGLDEVVGDAALLVPPDDVDALAEALARLAGDAALRARLRAAGPARAARFSLDRMVQGYEALYRELLTRS